MEYSKISSIELINFMSFKKAKVVFDESGILNIKGYNDSGKSAILRGLVVCLMDMFKRNQAKFIRHGEEYFRIVVSFDDGISILRDKYLNGQSLYEVYQGEELIFTTKQGNKLTRIEGVPQPIQDYLGLCVTDSVYLNYQSCIDKLPVVDTTGSENYQMFHEVLRMEEIYRASNMINTDKNELGARITEIEMGIQRDEVLLERCGDVSEDFIKEIQKLEGESSATSERKKFLDSVVEVSSNYENIKVYPKVEKVSLDRLKSVSSISEIVSSLDEIPNVPRVEKVSYDRLKYLLSLKDIISGLERIVSIPKIEKVDLSRKEELGSVISSFNSLAGQRKVCKGIDESLEKAKKELDEVIKSAREQGLDFIKCDNCGSYIVAGGGHTHE